MSGELSKLNSIRVFVSDLLEDDLMVVSPNTFEKIKQWYGNDIKLIAQKQSSESE